MSGSIQERLEQTYFASVGYLWSCGTPGILRATLHALKLGSANYFCEGPHSRYFRFCSIRLYQNHFTLPLKHKISHKQYKILWGMAMFQ